MSNRSLNRREFTGLCAASLVSVPATLGMPLGASAQSAPKAARTVKFRDGRTVPALGQGSARLAKGRRPQAEEEEAVRAGISLGMTVIDTAEIYGSEEFIGRAIAGQRDRVFLVSKVWPNHVTGDGIARACEASLARLGTDHLDLYLLHWPQKAVGISHVVSAFEEPAGKGKNSLLGRVQFRDPRNGRTLPRAARRPLRDQSDPLQSRRPGHRAWRAAMVQETRNADHGLLAARRRRRQAAAPSDACADWRRTRLLRSHRRAGLGHSRRRRHCDPPVRLGRPTSKRMRSRSRSR